MVRPGTETGNLTANLTFNYLDPTDIAGNEANYRLMRINGGTATNFPPPAAVVKPNCCHRR
jgi:hypothetical protein